MSGKSKAVADVAGHTLITVTRAHTRACSAHKGEPATPATPVMPAMEPVDLWLAERCFLDPNATCGTGGLFADWTSWALARGEYVGSVKAFALALGRRGFRSARTRLQRGFIGLALMGPAPSSRSTSAPPQAGPSGASRS